MPVLPSVTVSAALNLRGKAGSALAEAVHPRDPIQAAPIPKVAPMMNSLRFMVPPRTLLRWMAYPIGRSHPGFGYQAPAFPCSDSATERLRRALAECSVGFVC